MKAQFPKVDLNRNFNNPLDQITAPNRKALKPEGFSLFSLWFEGLLNLPGHSIAHHRKVCPPKHESLGLHWKSPFRG